MANVRNSRTTHPRRKARQIAAMERAAIRSERTAQEQLDLIASRPGQSRREVARIAAR